MPHADESLVQRVRVVVAELQSLDADLQRWGDRELGDVVKRARREFELSFREGNFHTRDIDLSAPLGIRPEDSTSRSASQVDDDHRYERHARAVAHDKRHAGVRSQRGK